ncbi:mitochondrial-processing peptidase subunit beta [Nematocida displodere]|uniref:Mitochondrial-processing peptidase subunit beta n=1 Tax=Nematocida displodere TaxID=1805483 RepID=A0A177EE36_9MICR|nr:mitochondrial-processing peptidase subunit beta [Nematocida displodere]
MVASWFALPKFLLPAQPTYTQTLLNNGITVATKTLPTTKYAVGVFVKGGASMERGGVPEGTAHLLEHMLIRDMDHGKLKKQGVSVSGHTSHNYVSVFGQGKGSSSQELVPMLLGALRRRLNPKLLKEEKAVVTQEYHTMKGSIEDQLDQLYKLLPGQGGGRSIMGTPESIAQIGMSHLAHLHQQPKTSGTVFLVGSGGISHQQMVALARNHPADIPRAGLESGLEAGPGSGSGAGPTATHLVFGFVAPGRQSQRYIHYWLLQNLVNYYLKQTKTIDASAHSVTNTENGMFSIRINKAHSNLTPGILFSKALSLLEEYKKVAMADTAETNCVEQMFSMANFLTTGTPYLTNAEVLSLFRGVTREELRQSIEKLRNPIIMPYKEIPATPVEKHK